MHRRCSFCGRRMAIVRLAAGFFFACCGHAVAAAGGAPLWGSVTSGGKPVAGALVSASGNDLTARVVADGRGRFVFPSLALGTYEVEAREGNRAGVARVDLGSAGATVEIVLEQLTEIAHAVVSRSQSPVIHGSGSDVVLNRTALTANAVQQQLHRNGNPDARRRSRRQRRRAYQRRSRGDQLHDRRRAACRRNSIAISAAEINLNDLSFVELIEGAYPAQYGLRFGVGLQHVDPRRHRPAGLRRVRFGGVVYRRAVDAGVPRTDCGRRADSTSP